MSWRGFYGGGMVGWSWSDFDWDYANTNLVDVAGATILGSDFDQDANSVTGGGLAGYNFQSGPWVFGIEGSLAASNLTDNESRPSTATTEVHTSEIDWLATVTGRVGFAWDRWLAFGKAGYAGANVELTLDDTGRRVRASMDTWANGWTIGAGSDYMVSDNVSLGLG